MEQARARLLELGLEVDTVDAESDQPDNTVIDVSPTGRLPLGSTVTLTYAVPGETATVPSGLVGQTEQEAAAAIRAAGLIPVSAGSVESDRPEGTVVSVSPSEGSAVEPGSEVSFRISEGPQETPTPTPSPSPSETNDGEGSGRDGGGSGGDRSGSEGAGLPPLLNR